ncbi:MAG: YdeI/OmpD-associated family protein [Vicinamibacterales bacterium]
MHASGLAAFERREARRSGIYAFEQRPEALPPALERRFRQDRAGWTHFSAQPPGYRRLAIWWVASAKREDTRLRRLGLLMDAHAKKHRIGVVFGQTGTVPTPGARARS